MTNRQQDMSYLKLLHKQKAINYPNKIINILLDLVSHKLPFTAKPI